MQHAQSQYCSNSIILSNKKTASARQMIFWLIKKKHGLAKKQYIDIMVY